MTDPVLERIDVAGVSVDTATWGTGPAEIVMLHDGLGSITQWRGAPAGLAARTGATVMAYDRAGHGSSRPIPTGPWPADWLHREAGVLHELILRLGLENPFLVGLSDGGSIVLIHAADHPDGQSGVASFAAHSYVEPINVEVIEGMRADPDGLVGGLSRHHDDAVSIFEAWSGVWVGDDFRSWDIRPLLAAVEVPTLVAQGDADQYGTDAMAIDTAAAIGANARLELIPGVGHLVHHEAPDVFVEMAATQFESIIR